MQANPSQGAVSRPWEHPPIQVPFPEFLHHCRQTLHNTTVATCTAHPMGAPSSKAVQPLLVTVEGTAPYGIAVPKAVCS